MSTPDLIYIESQMRFKIEPETGSEADWKNKCAEDLNTVMEHVQHALETDSNQTDEEFAWAAIRIAKRVAEFEQIEAVPRSEMEAK